jgi:peptidoglycan/LPS O-acetylase OafA/YrhL
LRDFFHRFRYFLPVAVVLGYLPAMLFEIEKTPFLYTWGFTLLYLANGALLLGALHAAPRRDPLSRAVSSIGVYSYSIYLWHILVALSVVPRLRSFLPAAHNGAWSLLAYLVLSLAVGIAMGRLVEAPALRLRDRLFPSPAAALPAGRVPIP